MTWKREEAGLRLENREKKTETLFFYYLGSN